MKTIIITENQYNDLKSTLYEWYRPSNYDSMPDKITLYHGTDYDGLSGIIESGIVDAKAGKRHGESYGINFFTINGEEMNFSKGYAFSIDVDKSEFENGTFRFENDSWVTSRGTVDIKNRNFKIVQAFYYSIDNLVDILENCINNEKDINNGRFRFFNFCKRQSWQHDFQQGIETIDDPIMLKVVNQFGISDDEWLESIASSTN